MKKRIYFHPGAIALLVLIPVVFTAIIFSVFEHTSKTLLISIIVDVFLWVECFWNIILCSGSVEADLDGQIFLVKRNIRSKEVQIKLSEIEKIYIDTTNLVLTENITNINKYVVIINEVSNLLDIEKERIVVYG